MPGMSGDAAARALAPSVSVAAPELHFGVGRVMRARGGRGLRPGRTERAERPWRRSRNGRMRTAGRDACTVTAGQPLAARPTAVARDRITVAVRGTGGRGAVAVRDPGRGGEESRAPVFATASTRAVAAVSGLAGSGFLTMAWLGRDSGSLVTRWLADSSAQIFALPPGIPHVNWGFTRRFRAASGPFQPRMAQCIPGLQPDAFWNVAGTKPLLQCATPRLLFGIRFGYGGSNHGGGNGGSVVGAGRSGRLVPGCGRDRAVHRPGSQALLSGPGIHRPQ
jgi:hypothetical protein